MCVYMGGYITCGTTLKFGFLKSILISFWLTLYETIFVLFLSSIYSVWCANISSYYNKIKWNGFFIRFNGRNELKKIYLLRSKHQSRFLFWYGFLFFLFCCQRGMSKGQEGNEWEWGVDWKKVSGKQISFWNHFNIH